MWTNCSSSTKLDYCRNITSLVEYSLSCSIGKKLKLEYSQNFLRGSPVGARVVPTNLIPNWKNQKLTFLKWISTPQQPPYFLRQITLYLWLKITNFQNKWKGWNGSRGGDREVALPHCYKSPSSKCFPTSARALYGRNHLFSPFGRQRDSMYSWALYWVEPKAVRGPLVSKTHKLKKFEGWDLFIIIYNYIIKSNKFQK